MTQPHSEADTRQQLIDERLRLAGWNVLDPSHVIQELDIYVGGDNRDAGGPPVDIELSVHQQPDALPVALITRMHAATDFPAILAPRFSALTAILREGVRDTTNMTSRIAESGRSHQP